MSTRSAFNIAVATLFLSPQLVQAQPPVNQPQGSRPGQTFHTNTPAGGQVPINPASQVPPASANAGPDQGVTTARSASAVKEQDQAGQATIPAGTPVIMEFSDLQCPDSAQFNSGLKSDILQRVNNSKAVYQWRDFPLPSHSAAPEAAAAARCAGGAAESMRQQIMMNQSQLSETAYAQYARQLGVDPNTFSACLRSGSAMREVMSDKELGQSMGVRGTPTLVLGTADGRGQVKPVKVVKAYDPPQQVLAEVDKFLASARTGGAAQNR